MRPALVPLLLAATLLAALALASIPPAQAAPRNPFIGGSDTGQERSQEQAQQSLGLRLPAFLAPVVSPVLTRLAGWQAALKLRMTALSRTLKERPVSPAALMFLLLCLGYGALHAAGPGHGKVFACAYFGSHKTSLAQALSFGFLTMGLHVASATVLVLGGAWLLKISGIAAVDAGAAHLERVSYALLLAVGCWLTLDAARELRAGSRSSVSPLSPLSAEADGCREANRRSLWALSLAVGLVPCPGAAMVLAFSLALGILAHGLAGMLAISLGMAATTTLVALAARAARGALLTLPGRGRLRLARLHGLVSLLGALALTALGALLLFGSLAGGAV